MAGTMEESRGVPSERTGSMVTVPFDPELSLSQVEAPLAWKELFGNRNPVQLEVGIGKGRFLIEAARCCSDRNFVGVERSVKYHRIARKRVMRAELVNIRLVCTWAEYFLSKFVPPASLEAIHVYFPDPWWKKRHHKRRLFSAEFVARAERLLQGGGWLHVHTDVTEYRDLIVGLIATHSKLVAVPHGECQEFTGSGLTNYEVKYRQSGREIYYLHFRRPDTLH